MHCQNPECLYANSLPFFEIFSKGSRSKNVLSFLMNLRKLEFITKKPPLIHPSPKLDFSLKTLTLSLCILITPNLDGGLTAVNVARAFFVL